MSNKRREQNLLTFTAGKLDARSEITIDHMIIQFMSNNFVKTFDVFMEFLKHRVTASKVKKIEMLTRKQHLSPLWHHMRYARITASIVHEIAHCRTAGKSYIERLMGSKRQFLSVAMARGQRIEAEVRKIAEETLNIKVKNCGLYISAEMPIFGASPDGIGSDFVMEIKCPMHIHTMDTYIAGDRIGNKFYDQIQWQMFVCQKSKGFFVVADPLFENNKKIIVREILFNEERCKHLSECVIEFYSKYFFPTLAKTVSCYDS